MLRGGGSCMSLVVMRIERNKGGATVSKFRAYALEGQYIDDHPCDPRAAVTFPRDDRQLRLLPRRRSRHHVERWRAPGPYMKNKHTQIPKRFATEGDARRYVASLQRTMR